LQVDSAGYEAGPAYVFAQAIGEIDELSGVEAAETQAAPDHFTAPQGPVRAARGQVATRRATRRRPTALRQLAQTRSAPVCLPSPSGFETSARGTGRPSTGRPAAQLGRRGLAGEVRPRPAQRPARRAAARPVRASRPRPGTSGTSLTARRPTTPRASAAPDPGRRWSRHRLDEGAGQGPER